MARTVTAPAPTPLQAWVTVAGWVATGLFFVGWVWFVAPARALWAERWVRVVAWVCLAPVAWWVVRTAVRVVWLAVRWLVGPFVRLAWSRVCGRSEVRDVLRVLRKGRKRGRKSGRRVARQIYGGAAAAA